MTIRCKFKVSSITHTQGYGQRAGGAYGPMPVATVRLNVVCEGTEEDKKFFASTPSGQIDVTCIHMEHAETFALGKEFYVDFTPAGE